MSTKTYPWPLPHISPEDFYSLDIGLQEDASRITASFIEAVLNIAQKDADKVIQKAQSTASEALGPASPKD